MRYTRILTAAALVGMATLGACGDRGLYGTGPNDAIPSADPSRGRSDVQVVSATGSIQVAVDSFRTLLGPINPNVAGEQAGGRREVNWDGVPAAFTNVDTFPGTFFNVNSPRGIVMTTEGTGFRVSNNGYTDVNPAYAGEFNTFSPTKLFVARNGTTIDVTFFVAGSNTPATVTGFGSVFADVGLERSTRITYFNERGEVLLTVPAPRATDATGLSFVGARFDNRIVSRVRITVGDAPLASDRRDGARGRSRRTDLVATDDFIYGEPRASH